MTKQEQIEEMAKVIEKTIRNECVLKTGGCDACNFLGIDTYEYECQSLLVSTMLYNTGYGKLSEYKAEIERLNRLIAQLEQSIIHAFCREQNVVLHEETIKSEARKETAKEILQYLYDKCFELDEDGKCSLLCDVVNILHLAEQYGVEVEE